MDRPLEVGPVPRHLELDRDLVVRLDRSFLQAGGQGERGLLTDRQDKAAVEPTDGQPQLRAGMTVTVSIDTEREPELAKFFNRAVAAVKGAD